MDPIRAPVFHLPIRTRLDASDELFDGLERPPMMQKQVDEGGESPVVIHSLPCSGFTGTAAAQRPGFVLLGGNAILPRPTLSKESRSDPLDAIDRALDLGLRVC